MEGLEYLQVLHGARVEDFLENPVFLDQVEEVPGLGVEVVGEELRAEMDAKRLEFLKRQVASYGYKIVNKNGETV